MKLRIGDQYPAPAEDGPPAGTTDDPVARNQAVYRVTRVVIETPWYGLYEAKKVFRNFNFAKGMIEEAADEECLDVFLKTLIYPRLDDRDFIKARRDHAWFEAKRVLGNKKTNLLPEPLDYLEVANSQDQFTFPRPGQVSAREPILVFEKVHGQTLARWRTTASPPLLRSLRVLAGVLEFTRVIHAQRFLLNGLSPAGLWVDETDQVHYMASETVIEAAKAADWRRIFPPERYIAGFAPPEAFDPAGAVDGRSDLFSWAALAYFLVTGESPVQLAKAQGQRHAVFEVEHFQRLREGLTGLKKEQIEKVRGWFYLEGPKPLRSWPEGLVGVLQKCLDLQPAGRPESVEALRAGWSAAPAQTARREGRLAEEVLPGPLGASEAQPSAPLPETSRPLRAAKWVWVLVGCGVVLLLLLLRFLF